MMKVLFSYWGFCESFDNCNEPNTPDGCRFTRPMFVDALKAAGHDVVSLQKMREAEPYQGFHTMIKVIPKVTFFLLSGDGRPGKTQVKKNLKMIMIGKLHF